MVESDDEQWEFASALLIPSSSSSSSDGSDSPHDLSESHNEEKPPLPTITVSVSYAPVQEDPQDDVTVPESAYRPPEAQHDTPEPCVMFPPTDHGLSRSALSHLKEFWSARYDEYARVEAYGGILESPHRIGLRAAFLSRFSRGARSPYHSDSPRTVRPDVNAPIYPRTGDLTILRDTRSAELDRAFSNVTLNSIKKILFLHDMLHRSSPTTPHAPELPSDISSDSSEDGFVDISLGSCGADSREDDTLSDDATLSHDASICPAHGRRRADCCEKHTPQAPGAAEFSREWEVDWIARWQVLLERFKEDRAGSPLPSPVDERKFWSALNPPPKTAKFFIEDDDEFFGVDSDEEDEEDYGHMLIRPSYRVSADSLSREFLHSMCELRLGTGL